MAEQGMEYSKKIKFGKYFKYFSKAIIVILVIVAIFIIISLFGASAAIILDNDSSDKIATQDERDDLKKWIEED